MEILKKTGGDNWEWVINKSETHCDKCKKQLDRTFGRKQFCNTDNCGSK